MTVERGKESTEISGIKFKVFKFAGVASSHVGDSTLHRTFHGGKCYQLNISTAVMNPQVFDPPVEMLSDREWKEVNGRLKQARDSFRFLN